MADFEGAVGIKTIRDDEVKIKLVSGDSGETATKILSIDTDNRALVSQKPLVFAQDTVDVSGSGVTINDGTETLAINSDGSINVVPTNEGSLVNEFNTSTELASNASTEFDYLVTDTMTFEGKSLLVGARGAVKVTFGTYDGTTFTPKGVYFQQPSINNSIDVQNLSLTGDGTGTIRVSVTNLDNQASDVYCSLQGIEK